MTDMDELEPIVYAQQISVPYRYSAGPVQRAFLQALQERRILGSRHGEQVLAPARPYGPDGVPTGETVEVAAEGELRSWTTRHHEGNVRTFGLIRLDGADSDLLHLVEAPEDRLAAGLRVRARWADEPTTEITAIEAFVPVD
jgi:uncharacterized protein